MLKTLVRQFHIVARDTHSPINVLLDKKRNRITVNSPHPIRCFVEPNQLVIQKSNSKHTYKRPEPQMFTSHNVETYDQMLIPNTDSSDIEVIEESEFEQVQSVSANISIQNIHSKWPIHPSVEFEDVSSLRDAKDCMQDSQDYSGFSKIFLVVYGAGTLANTVSWIPFTVEGEGWCFALGICCACAGFLYRTAAHTIMENK